MQEDPTDPITKAIGRTVMEWNDMCESFGLLFGAIIHPSQPWSPIAMAVWHSTTSDRAQRDMLREAALAIPDEAKKGLPKLAEDIGWLCERANSLADRRNDVVHAPLTMELDRIEPSKVIAVIPATFFGHPRALKLEGKDLIAEFALYTSYAGKLKIFSRQMMTSIQAGQAVHAWPDRPQLPNLRGKKNHQDSRRPLNKE